MKRDEDGNFKGYTIIHNRLLSESWSNDSKAVHLYCLLMCNANWKDAFHPYANKVLKRGQVWVCYDFYMTLLKVDKSKFKRLLKSLQMTHHITREKASRGVVVTMLYYYKNQCLIEEQVTPQITSQVTPQIDPQMNLQVTPQVTHNKNTNINTNINIKTENNSLSKQSEATKKVVKSRPRFKYCSSLITNYAELLELCNGNKEYLDIELLKCGNHYKTQCNWASTAKKWVLNGFDFKGKRPEPPKPTPEQIKALHMQIGKGLEESIYKRG